MRHVYVGHEGDAWRMEPQAIPSTQNEQKWWKNSCSRYLEQWVGARCSMSCTSRRCDVIQCLIIHLNNKINLFYFVSLFLQSSRTPELQPFNCESCVCVCVCDWHVFWWRGWWMVNWICVGAINKFDYVAISYVHSTNHVCILSATPPPTMSPFYFWSDIFVVVVDIVAAVAEWRAQRDLRITMMCEILAFSTSNQIWNDLNIIWTRSRRQFILVNSLWNLLLMQCNARSLSKSQPDELQYAFEINSYLFIQFIWFYLSVKYAIQNISWHIIWMNKRMAMDSMEITTICDCQLSWVVRVLAEEPSSAAFIPDWKLLCRARARASCSQSAWNKLILEAFIPQIQIYQVAFLSLSRELYF